ncbi:MAG: DNRLRE domain-containing protein, partial [Eubacterium sp.]|nr:DNRLRE domain-containing protein [Eubacterium sp.]
MKGKKKLNTIKVRAISGALSMSIIASALSFGGAFVCDGRNYSEVKAAVKESNTKNVLTENSTIYNLGNGKHKAVLYGTDVRYKDESGNWIDYDTSIRKMPVEDAQDGYVYEVTNTDKDVSFPRELSKESPVITEYDEYKASLAYKKKDQSEQELQVETSKISGKNQKTGISYLNVDEDVNLTYTPTNKGVKEDIVLVEKPDQNSYKFSACFENCGIITLDDMKKDKVSLKKNYKASDGESLYIYDFAEEKVVGEIPAAYMMDAKGNYSEKCNYTFKLDESSGGKYNYTLAVVVDDSFLKSKKTTYPVKIDPTISWDESNAYKCDSAYVSKAYPEKTYKGSNLNIMCVGGREKAEDQCTAFLRFGGLNGPVTGKYIDKVKLTIKTVDSSKNMGVDIYNLTSSFSPTNVRYSNQPKSEDVPLAHIETSKASEIIEVNLDNEQIYERTRNDESIYGFKFAAS